MVSYSLLFWVQEAIGQPKFAGSPALSVTRACLVQESTVAELPPVEG